MLQNGLAHVEGLGSACGLGEGLQAALDLDRQSDSYHGRASPGDIRVYHLVTCATIVRVGSNTVLLIVTALPAVSMIGSGRRTENTIGCVGERPYGAQKLN